MARSPKKTEERATSNLPMNIQEQLAKEAAAIQSKIAAPSGDRITSKGNSLIIAPDGSEGTEMEIVVLDFVSCNLYYDRPYNKDVVFPPACFALGPEPTLLIPSKNAPVRQCDTCSGCTFNQFGSAISGAGKACKNTRLLAISPADASSEDGEPPVWILSVPPASIKNFDAYVSNLAIKAKSVPVSVVTRLSLSEDSEYFAPRFDVVRPLTNEELGVFFPLREAAKARLMTEPDVSGYEPPAPRGPVKRR